MKNLIKILVTLMLTGLFLSSCQSTAGRKFDVNQVHKIIEGTSTKRDILKILGEPYRTNRLGKYKEKLMYLYTKSNVSLFALYGGSSDSNREVLDITVINNIVVECNLSRSFSQGSGLGGVALNSGGMGAGSSSSMKCSDLRN
jgi:outer membrane protein assembly factor BamE (lipoprotein component of BamABCDE complex)